MKLCPWHRDAIRTALAKRSQRSAELAFRAEAVILGVAIEHDQTLLNQSGCPICVTLHPSWIDQAVKVVVEAQ